MCTESTESASPVLARKFLIETILKHTGYVTNAGLKFIAKITPTFRFECKRAARYVVLTVYNTKGGGVMVGVCRTCKYWEKDGAFDHRCFNPKKIPRDKQTNVPLSPLVTGMYYGCDGWVPMDLDPKEVV